MNPKSLMKVLELMEMAAAVVVLDLMSAMLGVGFIRLSGLDA